MQEIQDHLFYLQFFLSEHEHWHSEQFLYKNKWEVVEVILGKEITKEKEKRKTERKNFLLNYSNYKSTTQYQHTWIRLGVDHIQHAGHQDLLSILLLKDHLEVSN